MSLNVVTDSFSSVSSKGFVEFEAFEAFAWEVRPSSCSEAL